MSMLEDRWRPSARAGYGIPEADIAGVIGIAPKTLRKHYRTELDHGHTKANARVAENLFRKATGEGREAVTAAIFWLKARAGWREVQRHELAGVPDHPIHEIRRIIIAAPSRENLINTPGLTSTNPAYRRIVEGTGGGDGS